MNIHFTDSELFESLNRATIVRAIVGSHSYGNNNSASDIDYLNIYATSDAELLSFIQTNHQLQFKENNIDYNFVSLHSFLRNIINGDSSINFEVIMSKSLVNTELNFLLKYRNTFITYTVIRNYLGLCRRDIKHFYKYSDNYNKEKRLKHIIRGYIYARDMINHTFDFDQANNELKSIKIDISSSKQLKYYESLISNLRLILTEQFNNKTLNYSQNINVEEGKDLTLELLNYCNSNEFKIKQNYLKDFKVDLFINSFENWVEY